MNNRTRKIFMLSFMLFACIPCIASAAESNVNSTGDFLQKKRYSNLTFKNIMEYLGIEVNALYKSRVPEKIGERFFFDKNHKMLCFTDYIDLIQCIGAKFRKSQKTNLEHYFFGKVLYDASSYRDGFKTLLVEARHSLNDRLGISFEIEHLVACHTLGSMIVANVKDNKLKEHFWKNLESLYGTTRNPKPTNAEKQENFAIEEIKTIEGLNDDIVAKAFLKDLVVSRKKTAGIKSKKASNKQVEKDKIFQPIIDKLKEINEFWKIKKISNSNVMPLEED